MHCILAESWNLDCDTTFLALHITASALKMNEQSQQHIHGILMTYLSSLHPWGVHLLRSLRLYILSASFTSLALWLAWGAWSICACFRCALSWVLSSESSDTSPVNKKINSTFEFEYWYPLNFSFRWGEWPVMYISWKLANDGYIGQNTGLPIVCRRQWAIIDFFCKNKE